MAKVSIVVGLKVALVEGFVNDWAVYLGKAEWDDEEVTHNGLKLSEQEARNLIGRLGGDIERQFAILHYRA